MQTAFAQKKESEKEAKPASSQTLDTHVDIKEEACFEASVPLFMQRASLSSPSTPPPIQRQPLEEEEEAIQTKADAFSIQRQPVEEKEEELLQTNPTNNIQRQSIEEEEEETVQSKTDLPPIQRQTIKEAEEELIQSKLTVGQPGDKYEQEADRVPQDLMRMPEPKVQRKAETYWFQEKPPEEKLGEIVTLEERRRRIIMRAPIALSIKDVGTVYVRFAYSQADLEDAGEKIETAAVDSVTQAMGEVMADLTGYPPVKSIEQRRKQLADRARFKEAFKFSEVKPLNVLLTSTPTPEEFLSGEVFPTAARIYINVKDIGNSAKLKPAIRIPIVRIIGGRVRSISGGEELPPQPVEEVKGVMLHELTHVMLMKQGCDAETVWHKVKSNLNISGPPELKARVEKLAKVYLLAQEEIFIVDEIAKLYPPVDMARRNIYEMYRIAAELFFSKELGAKWQEDTCKLTVSEKIRVPGKKKPETVTWKIVRRFPKVTATVTEAIKKAVKDVESLWPVQ